MTDFALAITSRSRPAEMSFTRGDDLFNNIFLSLAIRQGSWWLDPAFGLRDRGRMKNTEQNARLVREDCRQALQWLLTTGRAREIEVTALRGRDQERHWLTVKIAAIAADGRKVTFDKFFEVV